MKIRSLVDYVPDGPGRAEEYKRMREREIETKKRFSCVSVLILSAALVALMVSPAWAAKHTWEMTGTLTGNLVNSAWQTVYPSLADFNDSLNGAAGVNPTATAAGIVQGAAFSAFFTYDDATTELSETLLQPDNPNLGTYVTGGWNWTLGNLVARSAHGNNAASYALAQVITDPIVLTMDLIIFGGGNSPAYNGGALGLDVVTIAPDPLVAGDIGTNPGIILGAITGALADDSQLTTPPLLTTFPIQGFAVTLLDTSGGATDGQVIVLSGVLTALAAGTEPSCVSFGGDPDGDSICSDVDKCPADYDIEQYDLDLDGVGNACNDADDADGDEWADSLDNCPSIADPTNACNFVPVLGVFGQMGLVGVLGLVSLLAVVRGRVRV